MPTRTVGRYRLTKQLGVGMFSKVMLGIDDDTGLHYAVKVMRKESLEDMDMARYARREAAVLRKLSHPNIVTFVEAIQSDTKLFLVMELAPGSELLDVVSTGAVNEAVAKVYMRQLVGAVSYLHSKGIVHRDLKPDNVLVDVEGHTLKIIDFGLTGIIRKNALMRTSCGSSYYSAPEVTYGSGGEGEREREGYDGTKADAWSLGILAYILLTGAHPFVDADGDLMTAMMRQGVVEYPDYLSRGAVHFISRLLAIDARKRYSVAQVSLHPWLTGKPVPSVLASSGAGNTEGGIDIGMGNHGPASTTSEFIGRDRPRKETVLDSFPVRFASSKRPATFNGGSPQQQGQQQQGHHRSFFGRATSDRNHQSSSHLALRRRSSQKHHSSGSFLWFRRQHAPVSDALTADRLEHGLVSPPIPGCTTTNTTTTNTTTTNLPTSTSLPLPSSPTQSLPQPQPQVSPRTPSPSHLSPLPSSLPLLPSSSSSPPSSSLSMPKTPLHSQPPRATTPQQLSTPQQQQQQQLHAQFARRGSLDRPRTQREGRITLDFINARAAGIGVGAGTNVTTHNHGHGHGHGHGHVHDSSEGAGGRVRRQLSLSSRTRALLMMRGSHAAVNTVDT